LISQREQLWLKYLPKNAEFANHTRQEFAKMFSQYDLSGGQISLVIKNTAYKVATKKIPIFTKEDFIEHIKHEQSGNFDSEKKMGFGQ